MTGTESMNWYNFVERLAKSGKRLPNYAEFCAYAFGSPAGLDNANTNAWSATSNTGRGVTGSVVNAVSSVGVVDAVGRVWEWLDELITRAEHATNADYHASVAWGWDKKSPLNTGEKSYDVGNIYQYYAYSLAALIAGGSWYDGGVLRRSCRELLQLPVACQYGLWRSWGRVTLCRRRAKAQPDKRGVRHGHTDKKQILYTRKYMIFCYIFTLCLRSTQSMRNSVYRRRQETQFLKCCKRL